MTTRAEIAESRVFLSWRDYEMALERAVAPLTAEQLGRRLLPGRRTPGEITEHIVFGRALHLSQAIEPDAAELAPYLQWDGKGESSRTSAEIVQALKVTWRIIENQLMRGPSADALSDKDSELIRKIWGLIDYDLPHAGQLSLLLRAIGMPGVEI